MITVAAEIGMAHDGDIHRLAGYAAAARDCGFDVLKLQCHLPDESSPLEQWRVQPNSGESRLAYWTRTAWDAGMWRRAGQIIHDHGLSFGCSVFSLEAVALMSQVPELDVWKIPSGVSEWPAMRAAVETARGVKPVWISSGFSGDARTVTMAHCESWVVMHCVSQYPCASARSGLGWFREHSRGPSSVYGWSDHTGSIPVVLAAAGIGARVIELHFDPTTSILSPDAAVAWTRARATALIAGIREIESALEGTDKTALAALAAPLRRYYVPTRLHGRIAKHNGLGEPAW